MSEVLRETSEHVESPEIMTDSSTSSLKPEPSRSPISKPKKKKTREISQGSEREMFEITVRNLVGEIFNQHAKEVEKKIQELYSAVRPVDKVQLEINKMIRKAQNTIEKIGEIVEDLVDVLVLGCQRESRVYGLKSAQVKQYNDAEETDLSDKLQDLKTDINNLRK